MELAFNAMIGSFVQNHYQLINLKQNKKHV